MSASVTLAKYKVNVVRIGYGHRDIEVITSSPEAADFIAIEKAKDLVFSESYSEYEALSRTFFGNEPIDDQYKEAYEAGFQAGLNLGK